MVFLGGVALMLWFRDQGWHWAGGLIAALAFSYGASMAWRIQHIGQVLSLAYLPIAMVCLDRALARGSILYGVAAGFVAAVHRAGARSGGAAGDLSAGGLAVWRILSARRAARCARAPACCRSGPARVCAAARHRRAGAADRPAGRRNPTAPRSTTSAPRAARCIRRLLLTLVMPDVFGASGRMEDYWGPPSFAWPDTGIFLAQNMGQLYIGAIPLLLLLTPPCAASCGRRRSASSPAPRASRCSMRSAGTRPSSASSTRCCPASASIAGRRMRRF